MDKQEARKTIKGIIQSGGVLPSRLVRELYVVAEWYHPLVPETVKFKRKTPAR